MIGRKFGRLTVIGEAPPRESDKRKRLQYYYVCDCDPNKPPIIVDGDHLRTGHTKSCGCLAKEIASLTHKKYNEYIFDGDVVIGITSNTGNRFYIDADKYDLIKDHSWFEGQNGYIMSSLTYDKTIYLHRIIMNAKPEEIVDHKNHIKYDNRVSNLRVGTRNDNMKNYSMRSDNKSGFTGVNYDSRRNGWVAEIKSGDNKETIGPFSNIEDAIKVRKKLEEKYFGEWSFKNSTGFYTHEVNLKNPPPNMDYASIESNNT